jgi:hypothetical protein
MTRNSDRDAHTQIAETPEVRRRKAMREVKFPPGVEVIRMIHGKFDGVDTLLACTTDGVYRVDSTGVATKVEFKPQQPYRLRSTDLDYRPLWYALAGVATAVALWWTL